MPDIDAVLVAELPRIRVALERIATAMEGAVAVPAPAPGCLHPAETRQDFGLTVGVPDWQCGVCGYRSVAAAGGEVTGG